MKATTAYPNPNQSIEAAIGSEWSSAPTRSESQIHHPCHLSWPKEKTSGLKVLRSLIMQLTAPISCRRATTRGSGTVEARKGMHVMGLIAKG